jgi:molybdopterin synthase sulfur carrier subunit
LKILLFAHLKDEWGSSSLTLDLGTLTVADMLQELQNRCPSLSLGQIMIAVNEQFVGHDHLVQQDDIVALLPPVSGG